MKSRRVDLNSLLQVANLGVGATLFHTFLQLRTGEHLYMDADSALLGLLLVAQIHVALIIEGHRRDPFVLLFSFSLIIYHALRLYTLYLYPTSAVFDRFYYSPPDTNTALVFILLANVFLLVGLYVVRIPDNDAAHAGRRRATSPMLVLALLALTVMLTYLGGRGPSGAPRAIAALGVFLSPPIIVTMALVYWFLFRDTLSRTFKIALAGLIIVEIIAHSLWGSRSAVVAFVQTYLLVAFGVFGAVTFSRRLVIWGTLLMPLAMALLIGVFAVSTYFRMANDSGAEVKLGHAATTIGDVAGDTLRGPAAEALVGNVFARAGFLDFSAELIANRDKYAEVITLPAYARSLIDNIATPGFDLFDQPKIANSLMFVYRDWGTPSKRSVNTLGGYQSDQVGLYGELYVLFGYGSLPLFFVIAWALKRLYVAMRSRNPHLHAMKRVIVLSFFVRTIDSFGFDWTVGEILPFIVATYLYSILFASRSGAPGIATKEIVHAS